MSIRRTKGGLQSVHRFFKVDVVVYCEGSNSISYQDALSSSIGDPTLDTLYWSNFVRILEPWKKSFHFKSVGSKKVLNEISEDVLNYSISNVSVCRDKDYDFILGNKISGTRVAYTFGYSWENDVVQPSVLEQLFVDLVGTGPKQLVELTAFRQKLAAFGNDLARWIEYDISLYKRRVGCLFDRKGSFPFIDFDNPLNVHVEFLKERLKTLGYKRSPRRTITVNKLDSLKICFGKLISKAFYHYFKAMIKRIIPSLGLSYETFMRLAVAETFKHVESKRLTVFSDHIKRQREAFT